jgi:hypothetical protein
MGDIRRHTTEELNAMCEGDALDATLKMDEHPDNYEGPCDCRACLRDYGEPEEKGDW